MIDSKLTLDEIVNTYKTIENIDYLKTSSAKLENLVSLSPMGFKISLFKDLDNKSFIDKESGNTFVLKIIKNKYLSNSDKKFVLYCAWPDEATSASVARKMIDKGYSKAYALKGGWREWFRGKFPVEEK